MKFILGEKIDMTQLWQGEERQAVTRVAAGPCTVVQVKTKERDGYAAVQLGFGVKKAKRLGRAVQGHMKNLGNFKYLREFRLDKGDAKTPELQVGDQITAAVFAVGDQATVSGQSKGRGFAGVVKRHGFHGQDATHGNKDQLRMPGSIGSGGVQHVFKGMRMAGHMGDEQVTAHNIDIVKIDEDAGIIYLNGSVPGSRGSLVAIKAEGELKIVTPAKVEEAREEPEEVKEEVKEVMEEPVENLEIKTEEAVTNS